MSSHAQPKSIVGSETQGELEVLYQSLVSKYAPQDSTELFLVDRMVSALWFASRAAALLEQANHGTERIPARTIRVLAAYRASNEQSFDRAIQTLQQLRADQDEDGSLAPL